MLYHCHPCPKGAGARGSKAAQTVHKYGTWRRTADCLAWQYLRGHPPGAWEAPPQVPHATSITE